MAIVLDLHNMFGGHDRASALSNKYEQWKKDRAPWEKDKQELRNYVFATDTRHTSDTTGTWHNSTTVPKLCQIRDNLHANYRATIFSNSDWLVWEGGDENAVEAEVRKKLQAYIKTKLRDSRFERTVNKLIYDYVDYGNCFAEVMFKRKSITDEDGNERITYVGGELWRIDPRDIVFDLTSPTFEDAPKFVREVYNLGEVDYIAQTYPDREFFNKIQAERKNHLSYAEVLAKEDMAKLEAMRVDGFGSYSDYIHSHKVEILRFEGNVYDEASGLTKNKRIWIMDRVKIIHEEEMDDWLAGSRIRHVGWRTRQGNLMAMGPLDNLVGLQYRIDHLQNLKSDVFELTAAPPIKVKGYVESFDYKPFERIYVGDDGDVSLMSPDVNALNVDFEIDWIERKMEELAGSPRETMGMRTPGEKTAFEMQVLENGAARIFQDKIRNFEMDFLEFLANDYLEQGRRNADINEIARDVDPTYGAENFYAITPELLQTSGRLRAVASRHFAERARMAQNLQALTSSGLYADPEVKAHLSPQMIARMAAMSLDMDGDGLFGPNIRLTESAETQQLAMSMQQQNLEVQATPGLEEFDDQGELDDLSQSQAPL